jgi:phosphoribosylformylglycinamidine synthase
VIKPLMGADLEHLCPNNAAVQRFFYDDNYSGDVISYALNPRWGQKDMEKMVRGVFDQAIRNNVAHGGNMDRMAVHGNWCMANMKADDEEVGRFAKGAETFGKCEIEMDKCIIAGKDSMNNSHKDNKTGKIHYIPPTLLIAAQSATPDVRTCVSSYAKNGSDLIYIVGLTKPELGGSIFYENLGYVGNGVPTIDLSKAKRTYTQLSKLIRRGIGPHEKVVRACHSVTEGGIAAAAAQMAIGGDIGIHINLRQLPVNNIYHNYKALFSESLGRLLVEVPEDRAKQFEHGMEGCTYSRIGHVLRHDKRLDIVGIERSSSVTIPIETLNEAWKKPLRGYV